MSPTQKMDFKLDTALTIRLLIAVFAFTSFTNQRMIVPGFVALVAVGIVMFHLFVGASVTHKHIYIAAMTTWGSAAIAAMTYDYSVACVVMFMCLYIYELFAFRKWGFIHA